MKKIIYQIMLVFLCLILSGWGYKGHRIINQNTANFFPATLSYLKPNWTNIMTLYASEADNRKDTDPTESPKHYIDIDNYPEFVLNGQISQVFDSVVDVHGYAFVIDQGILPWATLITFDSLKACFARHDWEKSALFAADLGHYVGDGHMPLHLTRNYDGQYSGQSGIHSRYESKMVSRYESQLVYQADSVNYIPDVTDFVFSYIYTDYGYVDSVLIADSGARAIAGNVTSDAYYQALWAKSGPFTIYLLRHASQALASLIYTAWVQAGSPVIYPNAMDDLTLDLNTRILQNYPNPVKGSTIIPVEIIKKEKINLSILDVAGRLKEVLLDQEMQPGISEVLLNAGTYPDGIYFIVLKTGGGKMISKSFTVKN